MFNQLPYGGGASIALAPVDLAAAAVQTLWANTRDVNQFLWLMLYFGAGAAGEHATITLNQATSNAGAGSKALSIKEVWYKRGNAAFTNANASVQDRWTKSGLATREIPISSYATTTDRVSGANHFLAAIRISPKDLDLAGGFRFVQGAIADVGATAQLACGLWIPEGFAYSGDVPLTLLA